VDLSAAPFQTQGVAGTLKSRPGEPEISHSAAVPMVVVGERLVEYRMDS